MHKIVCLALLAALLVPAASAQAPEPTWTIELDAALPASVRPDSRTAATWVVSVTGQDLLCLEEQMLMVTLMAGPGGVAGVFLDLPEQVNVSVPMGLYVDEPFTAEVPLDPTLLVARFAEQGASGSFTITATLDPSGDACLPASSQMPEASVELAFSIEVVPEGHPLFHPSHEEHGDAVDAYLAPGQSFTYRFDHAGVYTYHDHIDPARKGSVTVHDDEPTRDVRVVVGPQTYDPADIEVGVGSNVTWTNQDSSTRTVSFDELHGAQETEHGHDDDRMEGDGHGREHDHGDESTSAPGILIAAIALLAFALRRRPAQPATV